MYRLDLDNTYKISFTYTVTGTCNSFCGAFYFTDFYKSFTGKPNPWGIKVWCAADPRSSYMLEFDIYLGHVLAPMLHGLGHHVIMQMAGRFLERGHHLFFDNYFSSVKLGQNLEETGTCTCSTIRMNRSGWPKELNAQCAKKMKAGDIHFHQDGNMVATLWKTSGQWLFFPHMLSQRWGSRKEGTRGQEEGGGTQTSSGIQQQRGGRRPG